MGRYDIRLSLHSGVAPARTHSFIHSYEHSQEVISF